MIKRIEAWLRRLIGTELDADLVVIEGRLSQQLALGLATIEDRLTQRLNELNAQTTNNVADAIVRLQQHVESEVQQMKCDVDAELNHYRASQAQRDADEMLRHPRHKR
jgi:hypothetical protein